MRVYLLSTAVAPLGSGLGGGVESMIVAAARPITGPRSRCSGHRPGRLRRQPPEFTHSARWSDADGGRSSLPRSHACRSGQLSGRCAAPASRTDATRRCHPELFLRLAALVFERYSALPTGHTGQHGIVEPCAGSGNPPSVYAAPTPTGFSQPRPGRQFRHRGTRAMHSTGTGFDAIPLQCSTWPDAGVDGTHRAGKRFGGTPSPSPLAPESKSRYSALCKTRSTGTG